MEVLARVRGELTAAGFEVVLLPATVEGDPAVVSETTGRELHPAAVIFVIEGPPRAASRAVSSSGSPIGLSRRTFVQSLAVDADEAGRGYRRLAIQAVELLKARLAELMVTTCPTLRLRTAEAAEARCPATPSAPRTAGNRRAACRRRGAPSGVRGGGFDLRGARARRSDVPAGSIRGAPFALDIGGTVAGFGSTSKVEHGGR